MKILKLFASFALVQFLFLGCNNNSNWHPSCKLVSIPSSLDNSVQKAYFFKSREQAPKPLIVSLHTWSGNYEQSDSISNICIKNDVNYIHPDFRGPNNKPSACLSDEVISDIDDAIGFAIENSNINKDKIFIVGASGGGYTALGHLLKSEYKIAGVSCWVPITNLEDWYHESVRKGESYISDIIKCTSSRLNNLNVSLAKKKSPINWKLPLNKISETKISIYAGINDGHEGPVSINHSINFYNKFLIENNVTDSLLFIDNNLRNKLIKREKSFVISKQISGRDVILQKRFKNIQLVIFDGGHEILHNYAIEEILKELKASLFFKQFKNQLFLDYEEKQIYRSTDSIYAPTVRFRNEGHRHLS